MACSGNYYPNAQNTGSPSAGNSKELGFSSPCQAMDSNNRSSTGNEDETQIAKIVDSNIRQLENIEQNDKTNAKIEELQSAMKVLENFNSSLKEHERQLMSDNMYLRSVYGTLYQQHQMLIAEIANVKQDNVNLKRTNEDLNKNKTNFETTYFHLTNYIEELKNKLGVIEEENKKFKNNLDNSTAYYTKQQSESKMVIEEPGQIETLSNEIIGLRKKCESYEDEFVYLSEELQKTSQQANELKVRNNELLKDNNGINERNGETIIKLNQKNKDLKQQYDNMEREKNQLKGEIHEIKHKLRKIEAENAKRKGWMEILEAEKEILLNRCKENDGKKDKIVKENKKFKHLIQEFQGLVQKKVQEIDDDEDLNESEEILTLDQNRVEIQPNSGVFCRTSDWKKLEKREVPEEISKKILNLIFTKQDFF